ncbi:MAG: hypothetical protein M1817_001668 [Caeruleum heppii]|nr:MAG: hypothetical protein M1817_001668 [Caeruleum heppii]
MAQPSTITLQQGWPSPTLTNPDMILPYTNDYRAETPSPTLQLTRLPSPPLTSQPNHLNATFESSNVQPVGKGHHMAEATPPMDSSEPFMNSSVANGASNESHLGSGQHIRQDDHIAATSLFPASHQKGVMTPRDRARETFAPNGPIEHEDGSSEDERILQSVEFGSARFNRDRQRDDTSWHESSAAPAGRGRIGSVILEEADEDQLQSAALSQRAELILANAKKRLDQMEGNLSRARHSLIIAPSPFMSPRSSHSRTSSRGSPVSPPRTYDRRLHPPLGIAPTKHRQAHPPSASMNDSPGHARISSETSVPSSLYTSQFPNGGDGSRAKSALENLRAARMPNIRSARSAIALRDRPRTQSTEDVPEPPSVNERNYLSPLASYSHESSNSSFKPEQSSYHHTNPSLTGLGLRDVSPDIDSSSNTRLFTNTSSLSRSQSTVHMRDVRVQMRDLKGRISNLQQRAREDSMKRRSLQSLRTPSPFTAAEAWYLEADTGKNGTLGVPKHVQKPGPERDMVRSVEGEIVDARDEEAENSVYDESVGASQYEDAREVDPSAGAIKERAIEDESDPGESYGSNEHASSSIQSTGIIPSTDAVDGEDGPDESYAEPASTVIGERHEDRPDAFDYEHFFLHSAMGGFAKPAKGRRDSQASDESVETTRGLEASKTRTNHINADDNGNDPGAIYRSHQRQASAESISTVATFATATEGRRGSETESMPDDLDYADRLHSLGLHTNESQRDVRPQPVTTRYADSEGRSSGSHTPTGSVIRANGHVKGPTSAPSITADLQQHLHSDDRLLIEEVRRSLDAVMKGLATDSRSGTGSYEARRWRRRLDGARRILDGEGEE